MRLRRVYLHFDLFFVRNTVILYLKCIKNRDEEEYSNIIYFGWRCRMLVGREKELHLLHDIQNDDSSHFVAVYGRRRVGKTFLIREAFG